jgi:hypothetical protein
LGGNIWEGFYAIVWVISNDKFRGANVILKHFNCCEETSSGRLLFVIMVVNSRNTDFLKVKKGIFLYKTSFSLYEINNFKGKKEKSIGLNDNEKLKKNG